MAQQPKAESDRYTDMATEKSKAVLSYFSHPRFQRPRRLWLERPIFVVWQMRVRAIGVLRRAFDVTVSLLALSLIWPMMAVFALLIRLESPGPVIFRQTRLGKGGALFTCYKFRSMCIDAEDRKTMLLAQNEVSGPMFKMQRDPRVTRVGAFIRKFSIDELPQLFNVLKGEMSIVGPRPPVPDEVQYYDVHYLRRLDAMPGLTGLPQISGRSNLDFERWVELDLEYISRQGLRQDLLIVLKTIPAVLFGKGAY